MMGREYALVEGLAKVLHEAAKKRGDYTNLYPQPEGFWFRVHLHDPDGEPTNRVAKVVVTYDGMETP